MIWIFRTLSSSIGKKLLMAVTGLCFCGFLAVHLLGNLTVYGGKSTFLSYVEHLHSLGFLITIVEWGLVIFAVVHIVIGMWLFVENLRARPVRYVMKKSAGGRSIGSATAPYTGILLLVFLIIHLLAFRFVDKTRIDDFTILTQTFTQIGYVLFYIIGVIIAAVHVSHGFWSGFQTLGLNHPKYMPIIRTVGILFSFALGIGFGSIPIYLMITL
ncbi:MAG: succinate dehydrogenase cytochrome b subunit [Deltaproteobacteria bacterium]|nr:succinate dehydrogenase cytochrome b subunit [Deltaproteobacteria bacterium]MBW2127991.1 succinate dehydrogenase cytochrome b subunit [Deltaproteobacteria bacterium]MBW2302570.1 succinate dehydrogenase cytochrome b subunit [Deltaproteobacteria bacterium]